MKKIGSLVAVMVLFLLFGYNANADKTDNVYPWQSVYLQLLHEVRDSPYAAHCRLCRNDICFWAAFLEDRALS